MWPGAGDDVSRCHGGALNVVIKGGLMTVSQNTLSSGNNVASALAGNTSFSYREDEATERGRKRGVRVGGGATSAVWS